MEKYTVFVPCGGELTLSDMILSCDYNWCELWGGGFEVVEDERFNVNLSQPYTVEIELVSLGRVMPIEAVIQELVRRAFRPCNLWEFLALDKAQPNRQRRVTLVGLGTKIKLLPSGNIPAPDRGVLCLQGDRKSRRLLLGRNCDPCDSECLFPAVRIKQAA